MLSLASFHEKNRNICWSRRKYSGFSNFSRTLPPQTQILINSLSLYHWNLLRASEMKCHLFMKPLLMGLTLSGLSFLWLPRAFLALFILPCTVVMCVQVLVVINNKNINNVYYWLNIFFGLDILCMKSYFLQLSCGEGIIIIFILCICIQLYMYMMLHICI